MATGGTAQRFPIRFTGLNRTMKVVGMSPANSWVQVADDDVEVRMGWAFHLGAPRSAVASAEIDTGRVLAWGVHGRRQTWVVNGSSSGLVRVTFEPPVKRRVVTVGRATVQVLRVSVEDPDGLVAALGG